MRIEHTLINVRHLGRDRWLGRAALIALWAGGLAYIADAANGHMGGEAACGVPFLLLAGTSLIVGLNHGRSVAGTRSHRSGGRVVIEGDFLAAEGEIAKEYIESVAEQEAERVARIGRSAG